MSRPIKCRKVCCLPKETRFVPEGLAEQGETILMTVDEYETIRLIDKQGFSQQECGFYMHVARTTVQQMYASARKKLALALVDGRPIAIHGGNYELCDGTEHFCSCGGCLRHREMAMR